MTFDIYLKKDIGNEISYRVAVGKKFNVATVSIQDGLLKKGSYYIPVDHILFIKEV